MQATLKTENSPSPMIKKRVRICSLNSQKRKVVTECNVDENIQIASPRGCASPRVINLHRKINNQYRKLQQPTVEQTPKVKHHSIKTQANRKSQNTQQFDKLLEITSRCVDYFHKFTQEKDAQIKIVREAFAQIHQHLNAAFNGIIMEVKNKQNQITNFLQKKQSQLIKIKQQQQLQLNSNLADVKSVHLVNLLRDYKSGDQSADLQQQLCGYANTLHKFYEAMEKVEKCNFKQGVDETINFINNIISEQLKFIIYQKIPNKSLNGSFSFNDGLGFGTSLGGGLNNFISADFNCQPSLGESLEHSIQKCMKKTKNKQTSQAWTQTLSESMMPKISVLQALNQINRHQNQLKSKIDKYKELKF